MRTGFKIDRQALSPRKGAEKPGHTLDKCRRNELDFGFLQPILLIPGPVQGRIKRFQEHVGRFLDQRQRPAPLGIRPFAANLVDKAQNAGDWGAYFVRDDCEDIAARARFCLGLFKCMDEGLRTGLLFGNVLQDPVIAD